MITDVRRIYCFESSRNRVQGILPFAIPGGLEYPNMTYPDGNWGQFVADFGYEEDTEYGYDGETILNDGYKNEFFDCHIKEKEEGTEEERDVLRWRFKYKNLMRYYNHTINLVRNGVVMRRGSGQKVIPEVNCISGETLSSWWTDFFSGNTALYSYQPVNISDVDQKGTHLYEIKSNVSGDWAIAVGDGEEDAVAKIKAYKDEWDRWMQFVGKKVGETFTPKKDVWSLCKDVEEKYIGYLYIPENISGLNVPDRMPFADVFEFLEWFEINEPNKMSCCVHKSGNTDYIFSESDEWLNHGGQEMWDYLKTDAVTNAFKKALENIKKWEKEGQTWKRLYLAPVMDVPVLMTQSLQDDGNLTAIKEEPTESIAYYMDMQSESGWVESQLSRVRMTCSEGSDSTKVNGVFQEYPTGATYFRCTFSGADWYHTSVVYPEGEDKPELYEGNPVDIQYDTTKCIEIDSEDADIDGAGMDDGGWVMVRIKRTTADGEEYYEYFRYVVGSYWVYNEIDGSSLKYTESRIKAYNNAEYYIKLTMKEVVPGIYRTPKTADFVNVLADYQCHIDMPYSAGVVYNKFTDEYGIEYGDYIISMEDGHFIYNIGGLVGQPYARGYVIEEDYEISEGSEVLSLDGVSIRVPATIMTPVDTINSYNESLNMMRYGVARGRLVGITTDLLDESNSAILFKRDGDAAMMPGSKISVDISMDRGASAAFESFFKLAECNTMEDLENYGNDYFNLQSNEY